MTPGQALKAVMMPALLDSKPHRKPGELVSRGSAEMRAALRELRSDDAAVCAPRERDLRYAGIVRGSR